MSVCGRFVDTHLHFWDHSVSGLRWAWLEPGAVHAQLGALSKLDAPRFSTEEFRAEMGDLPVDKMVHVAAVALDCDPVEETRWLQHLAETTGWPNAIIGHCQLADEAAPVVIKGHAAHERFRGVRDMFASAGLGSADFDRGCTALAETGGCCELLLSWERFGDIRDLAKRHPDMTIILDHAGLPVRRSDDYYRCWSVALSDLAEQSRVVCKISSLGDNADPNWTVDTISRWVLKCIEVFGADRCMFGSNWPVVKLFGPYRRIVDAYSEIISGMSATEQEAVFAGTAERVYRI